MTVNEAQEDCSQDGRTPRELWDALDERTRDLQQAQATIQRVRELHMERNVCYVREHTIPGSSKRCGDCMTVCTECHRCWEGYPCPTTRALEGGEAS